MINFTKPPSLFLIIIFSAIVWGSEYVNRALWEPDEARYAYVAKEMKEEGHWAIPHRHGIPYSHKPPLMFWLIQLSSKLTFNDINRISTRLPSLFGAILALWSLSRIAYMWGHGKTAWTAPAILSTTPIFWQTAGMGQIDALLCGLESAALYFMFSAQRTNERYRRMIAFILLGMGILAKGPVGLIVPIGIYIAVNLAAADVTALKKPYWLWGILLALIFPAVWLIAAWIEGAPASYFKELLWSQNLERAAGEWGHIRPFYYYVLQCPVEFLPWTLVLPASIISMYRRQEAQLFLRKCLVWALFVTVFFSIPASKRNLYVIMAYLPLAMIIAEANNTPFPSYIPLLISFFYAMSAVVVIYSRNILSYLEVSTYLIYPILLLVITAVGLLWLYFAPTKRNCWLIWIICTSLILEIMISTTVYPQLNNIKTPQVAATKISKATNPSQKLILYGINAEIIPLYAKRRGLRIDDQEELWEELFRQRKGVVVFDSTTWQQLKQRFGHIMDAHYFQMGNKNLVWCFFDVKRQK